MNTSTLLRELRRRARELDQQYTQVSQDREYIHGVIAMLERESGDESNTDSVGSHTDVVTDAIADILTEEGKPLHRSVILERIQAKGIYVGGHKPVNTLGSYLSLDPRFMVVGRGVWALVDSPKESDESEHSGSRPNPMLDGLGNAASKVHSIIEGTAFPSSIAL